MAQLSMEERVLLSQLHSGGHTDAEIGKRLKRSRSTVWRERQRNAQANGSYEPVAAHRKAAQRRRERPLIRKLQRAALNNAVRERLTQEWSPEQISGRLKQDYPNDPTWHVAPQTIYTWLHRDENRDHWRTFLRRGTNRPKSREAGRIPRRVEIDGRPAIINQRERLGDFEGDTIVSGGRNKTCLVTLVDRKSGWLSAGRIKDRTASRTRQKIVDLLALLPVDKRHSATFDNGKEFTEHEALARSLGISVYFAHPYASWERGTNEHTNGLLRQYYPKGTDFALVSHQDLAEKVNRLNNRPRKRHNYQTPSEIFFPQSTSPCRD
jgi:IS30 family transposase